jgi:UV DNA damage repair endonuclease
MATEPTWRYVWQDSKNREWLEQGFAKVGEMARARDVRLSFHPGQFTVLASADDGIVERSIDEFEYHVDMIRWMGFGQTFQDFKCNVHISGKRGYQGIIDILPRLSPEARNTITIENDETKHGLDASLMLADHVPLVLDLHHHWIRDEEYISPNDDRVKRVIDSWRGVRPALHYSYSRDHGLQMSDLHKDSIDHTGLHDIGDLLETGAKKAKLRAHSDMYPNPDTNQWALSFWPDFDIQCEAKHKNLATDQLYAQALAA